jgi:DNA polymerase-3 subunit epsilon
MVGLVGEPPMECLALDIETTGLSPTRHRIRELAVVSFSGAVLSHQRLERFDDTDFEPSRGRGIRARVEDILATLQDVDTVTFAHNAAFDLAFLAESFRGFGFHTFHLRAYCTLRLARLLLPELGCYDLAFLRTALSLGEGKAHVALDDALAVAKLFMVLSERAPIADEAALSAIHGPPVKVRYRSGTTETTS